jgi:hypothetical protein
MILRTLSRVRALSPQSWGVLALVVAASFASGSATGWTLRAWKCEAARTAEVETAAADARASSAAVITDLLTQSARGDAADRAVERAHVRTEGIFRGLEARAEALAHSLVGEPGGPPARSDCPGAAGQWVQLWNAANAGIDAPTEAPGPTGPPDPAVRDPPAAEDRHPERR